MFDGDVVGPGGLTVLHVEYALFKFFVAEIRIPSVVGQLGQDLV